jgi:CheY-like chemotaxis protein
MAMKIVVLEDNVERQAVIRSCLADRFYMYEHHFFDDACEANAFLHQYLAETIAISLDHDLEMKMASDGRCVDPGNGRQVADFLATQMPVCPIIVHTTNGDAAVQMLATLKRSNWRVRRVLPFDDMNWIPSTWFPALRRAIVGPIRVAAS